MPSLHSHNLQSSKQRRAMTSCYPSQLLPGLPYDLAILCLARVPSLSLLWRVCPSWQAMVSRSDFFHSLRSSLGFKPQQWIYALLHHPQEDPFHSLPSQESLVDDDGYTAARCSIPAAFSWHAFDPISNFWHCLPPFPHPIEFYLTSPSFIGFLHSVQCSSSATKLFMVAGSRLSRSKDGCLDDSKRPSVEPALDSPLIFDTQTGEWMEGAPFSVPRKWCACGTVAGKLMVASGCGREWDMPLSKSAEMYDPEVRRWFEIEGLESSTFSRTAISAVNYKGKLHMVSGMGTIYDPATGKWENMPRGMKDGWSGQSVVVDGNLYLLEESPGRLKVYEEGKDQWKYVVMEEELLKNMEQLAGGVPGRFFGIVRATTSNGTPAGSKSEQQQDVIRVVDIRNGKPIIADLRLPLMRQIVALQVLSRTCNIVQ